METVTISKSEYEEYLRLKKAAQRDTKLVELSPEEKRRVDESLNSEVCNLEETKKVEEILKFHQ